MGAPAATRGPFGSGAFPGLGELLPWPSAGCCARAELGRKSETSLWKYPLGWKLWSSWERCSCGRFLQGLRRAEVGAGGQKETAPASGTCSLEGRKEGRKEGETSPAAAVRVMERAPVLLLLSSLWGCSGKCHGTKSHPNPPTHCAALLCCCSPSFILRPQDLPVTEP